MTTLRSLTLPALATLLLFGCGSSSSSGTGGAAGTSSSNGGTTGAVGGKTGTAGATGSAGGISGGGDPKNLMCTSTSTGTCTDADFAPYQQCIMTACTSGLQTCYGTGYTGGQFSGPCGVWAACTSKCACSDAACRTACGTTPTECTTCLSSNIVSCSLTCTLPACILGGAGGLSGGLGGAFGGFGGFFGGLGGSTGASAACVDDLTACCNRAASAQLKSACQSALTVFALVPSQCEASAASFKTMFCP